MCSLTHINNLATLTLLRAEVEFANNDFDQALSTAIAVVSLGGLIGNSEYPTLIELLVGINTKNMGLQSIERMLNNPEITISYQIAQSIIEILKQSRIKDTAFADSLCVEYMTSKETLATFEQFSNYFYQHNKTTNHRAEMYRIIIDLSLQECDVVAVNEQDYMNEFTEDILHLPTGWRVLLPNSVGKILNSVMFNPLLSASTLTCSVNELNEKIHDSLKRERDTSQ